MKDTIRFGLNARLFPANWRPARDEIAFAAQAGFDCLQFRGPEHGIDKEYLGDDIELVAEQLHASGIEAVLEIILILQSNGRSRTGLTPLEVLQHNLPAIRALPCSCVHWHMAAAVPFPAAEIPALERSLLPQLAEAVGIGQQEGFAFGLEHNETGAQIFARPEAIAMALEEVPGLGFVWDLNHSPAEDVPDYLAFVSRMTMLHLADTPLPILNYHLPIGQGSVDFAPILSELHRRNFRGPGILEIGGLPKSGGFGRDTDQALSDSLARLRAML